MTTRSFSDINSFLRCAKQHYYRNIRKLQRKERSTNLTKGTAIHRLVMAGYLLKQSQPQAGLGLITLRMADEVGVMKEEWKDILFSDELLDLDDMLNDCFEIVRGYFEKNTFEGWEILHVEEEFHVEIDGKPVSFTPDLVARDPSGAVWIIDHKSTQSLPHDGVPFSSQQSLLYFAGVKAFYPETAGFVFNYLRKKRPTQPRLNKTKNKESGLYFVSDLNRIDTTYERLYAFISEEAPELFADSAHKRRLAELRDQPDRFYYQKRVLTNEAALEQMVEETSWVLDDMARAEELERFPRTLIDDRGYLSCKKCEFQDICQAELLDFNVQVVLRDNYEPRDPKNKYESDEDDE